MRFSDNGTSNSNLPNLKFSQGELARLSKRTFADSNPTVPSPGSIEGTSRNEMFLAKVPAVRMSMPLRSKPEVLMVFSMVGLVGSPGTEVTAVWPALS